MRAITCLGDDMLPRAKKTRALLAYLCFAFGTAVPRARLAAMLWDGASAEQARASLRHALSELCAAMGPLAGDLVSARRATVRLHADLCWIDALALLGSGSRDDACGDLALLCSDELLEEFDGVSAAFDRWLDRERARLRERVQRLRAGRPMAPPARKPLPGRNRIRAAVLPFETSGAPPEQDLAFSLSYGIAAAMARFRWLDVISPLSALFQPLVNVTTNELIERKQLDYAIDGAVSRCGRDFHLDIRLLDLTRHTEPVWSESFKLSSRELHQLNETVAARVVDSIDPVVRLIEDRPVRREHRGTTSLLLLAVPLLYTVEPKKFRRAGELLDQALMIDPDNAVALAWAAFWQITVAAEGHVHDIAGVLAKAEALCLKALQIDPDNAEALGVYAHTCAWKQDFDSAIRYFDRALRINSNLAFLWALSAPTYCYIGDPDAALRRLKRYRELAPFDPDPALEAFYAIAYTFNGQYEQAVLVGRRAVKTNPHFTASYKPLIASLGHLGRPDEAGPFIRKLQSLQPNFTIARFAQTYPFKRDADRERYCEGLRLAGVPER
jgi:tetratricopeptide (TPR) repeat protein